MLDVSGKFTGTVLIISDQTEFRQIEEQLRYLGFRDTLTGLYNRRYMDMEVSRLSTGRFNPVGIVSCDIDGLKLVNDNLGHQAGDMLVQMVAYILQSCFGESDVVCRTGGDEFINLIPFGSDAAIKSACGNARDMLAEYNDNNRMPISISIGWVIGDLSQPGDIMDLMKEADNRMYTEKKRNHIRYVSLFLGRIQKFGSALHDGFGSAGPAASPLWFPS
jgi:diguanylate cyclase (GGDEF)-like protein